MLKDKVVLVTGGAQGIGRYIAHGFAREGARVGVADILPLENVSREIEEMDAEVEAVTADVRDEDQVRRMVDRVLERFGRIDVLVNDAGIVTHFAWGLPRWAPIKEMEKSFWDNVIGTNLGGTFLCTKHVLPQMETQRGGHVINLYGGGFGVGATAYLVSKEAIRMFTRCVADEEREHNICVVILCPGGIIATENASEAARREYPGPELAANRFQLAAEAGMDFSGHLLDLQEGRLVIAD